MSHPIERHNAPTPADMPQAPHTDTENPIYGTSLRGRLNRWTEQLAAKIDADGGSVLADGSTHPDLDLFAALIDAGCNLRRATLARRLGDGIISRSAGK
jgi:hypothetical protein